MKKARRTLTEKPVLRLATLKETEFYGKGKRWTG
jgi:hypothetical protein